jgi:putative membrane protein
MRALIPLSFLAALGGLSLAGCDTLMPPAAPAMNPLRAPGFVALAASSDMFEIESSRMALQRAQDPMLRMHAELMIRDHTNTSAQLSAAAQSLGIPVPVQMQPMHLSMLDALSRSPNFDATYRQQQLSSHQQALNLMSNYARHGDVPQLRGLAAATVPVIRSHLDHLRM